MRPTWPSRADSSAICPDVSSGSRSTRRTAPPIGSRCRRGSSTSAARRRPPTSAPPRSCWPWSPPCTPCTTAPRDCAALPAVSIAAPVDLADGSGAVRLQPGPPGVLRHGGRRGARSSGGDRRRCPTARGAPPPRRRRPRGDLVRRDDHGRAHRTAVLEAFGCDGGGAGGRRPPCPRRSCAGARFSTTPSSRSTTPRRRCSATCAGSPTRTSRSTAA